MCALSYCLSDHNRNESKQLLFSSTGGDDVTAKGAEAASRCITFVSQYVLTLRTKHISSSASMFLREMSSSKTSPNEFRKNAASNKTQLHRPFVRRVVISIIKRQLHTHRHKKTSSKQT